MKLSTDRILTTHVGSLPRPQDVVDLIFAQDRGEPIDQAKFDATVQRAVDDVIRKQVEMGVDIPSDGEQSKISYATYIRHRLTGFEGDSARPTPQDLDDFPDYRDKLVKEGHSATYKRPVCKGEIKVKSLEPVKEDIARMKSALAKANVSEGFMNSVSPGTVAVFQPNEYYPTHEAYMAAVAEGMRAEYEEIMKSGLLLQLDCPDLAMGRHSRFKNLDEAGFLRNAEIQVEALNHALANVAADRVRMHVCWGNYEGPHTHDIALTKILPIILKAKPMAFLLEGANPRHAHEWEVWKTHKLPADKVLVPGVVETTSNFVEHPEVVAQRIVRYAEVIGRERILAGSDCGFGTFAGFGPVHPSVGWMKLKSLSEGAAIASKKLWGKAAPHAHLGSAN
jgi:5-methyltetrahydropteroyltriglutamate--homocysteine methyltransferase